MAHVHGEKMVEAAKKVAEEAACPSSIDAWPSSSGDSLTSGSSTAAAC